MTAPPVRVDLARLEELCANKEYIAPEKVRALIESVRVARGALEEAHAQFGNLPSGFDDDADSNNPSPEDASAHTAGLARRAINAALSRIGELVSDGENGA